MGPHIEMQWTLVARPNAIIEMNNAVTRNSSWVEAEATPADASVRH
jgi:hypothetical protein